MFVRIAWTLWLQIPFNGIFCGTNNVVITKVLYILFLNLFHRREISTLSSFVVSQNLSYSVFRSIWPVLVWRRSEYAHHGSVYMLCQRAGCGNHLSAIKLALCRLTLQNTICYVSWRLFNSYCYWKLYRRLCTPLMECIHSRVREHCKNGLPSLSAAAYSTDKSFAP